MNTKFIIYTILLVSTIASLFYLSGISFFMYFGKIRNIEIDTGIDNQLKINYSIIFILILIIFFLINRIKKLTKTQKSNR
jgi:hypothetical protein